MRLSFIFLLTFSVLACSNRQSNGAQQASDENAGITAKQTIDPKSVDTATVAGGCFWCIEASFEQIKGVKEAVSGYAGGESSNPTYQQVSAGRTEHAESVQIYYDPKQIDYNTILKIFFTAHDPTQLNRQGPDIGKQYRSVIFYHNETQRKAAEAIIQSLQSDYEQPIVTKVQPLKAFYEAEEYHQDYERKHPNNSYIRSVSRPKINKVRRSFNELLKDES